MFHSFFQFPCKVEVLILFFTFFQLYSVVSRDSKVDNFTNSRFLGFYLFIFFFFSCLVFWPRLGDPSVCQSPIGIHVSFSWAGAGLCIYHLFVWSNLNILRLSKWITLPTQSCLVLYSFGANLLHTLIM